MSKGISMYNYTKEDLQELANQIKDLVLEYLEGKGDIKSAQDLGSRYIVTLKTKGMFGQFYDKVFTEDEGVHFTILEKILK